MYLGQNQNKGDLPVEGFLQSGYNNRYLKELKRGEITMLTQFSRTELLLGKEVMDRLAGARVAVFGVGGVGGYVCEALVRSGVGAFDLIDEDTVCLTNLL